MFLKPTDVVTAARFEALRKELQDSLKREQQAQTILYQQSFQLENLTQRLAECSNIDQVKNKLDKKEKQLKQLKRKTSGLQAMKENYENSATEIIL